MISFMGPNRVFKYFHAFIAIVTLSILYGCDKTSQFAFNAQPQALGTLEWDRLNGRAVASEVITDIYVNEGDLVIQGQALLKLDDSLQLAHVKKLEAIVEQSRWFLRQLESGYRLQEIASAKAELEARVLERQNREKNFLRQKNLRQQNLNSQRNLDDAKQRFDTALAQEEIALQKLKEFQSGYRVEEVEQARASLNSQQAELEYQQQLLSRYTVIASRAGKVDSLPYKLGDKPPINSVLTTVLAGDRPWARVYLPQAWLSKVSKDNKVIVNVDGLAEDINGRVRFISAVPTFTPYYALSEQDRSRLMYVTEVELLGDKAKTLPLGVPVQMQLPE